MTEQDLDSELLEDFSKGCEAIGGEPERVAQELYPSEVGVECRTEDMKMELSKWGELRVSISTDDLDMVRHLHEDIEQVLPEYTGPNDMTIILEEVGGVGTRQTRIDRYEGRIKWLEL